MATGPNVATMFHQQTSSGQIDAACIAADDVFHEFMHEHQIRAAALAVMKGATVLVHRGYTHSTPGYPATQPDSKFRLASVSKMLTCAALTRLVAMGRLTWETPAFPFLNEGLPPLGPPADVGMDTITVGELLDHKAFLQHGIDNRAVGIALNINHAPTLRNLVEYTYRDQRLPRFLDPGAGFQIPREHYSNLGYAVLTAVVEKAAREDFVSFLHREVTSEVWQGRTLKSGALPGEVSYDDPHTGLTQLIPGGDQMLPMAYGGGFILENSAGAGGLVSTALAIARLGTRFAVWGRGGRSPGTSRSGDFSGTWAWAQSLANIDIAFMFNRSVESRDEKEAFVRRLIATLPLA